MTCMGDETIGEKKAKFSTELGHLFTTLASETQYCGLKNRHHFLSFFFSPKNKMFYL